MDDVAAVGQVHRLRQCLQQSRRLARRQGAVAQPLRQVVALDELQGAEGQSLVLADLVDLHDVRVRQPGRRLRLGAEAGHVLGAGVVAHQDHLEGHAPLQGELAGAVDDAHAAPAQHPLDLVPRHGRQRHGPPGRLLGKGAS